MGNLLLSVYQECVKTLRTAPSVFILWASESKGACGEHIFLERVIPIRSEHFWQVHFRDTLL